MAKKKGFFTEKYPDQKNINQAYKKIKVLKTDKKEKRQAKKERPKMRIL